MRIPPLEHDDMVALGVSPQAVISSDGQTITVDPPAPRHIVRLLADLMVRQPPDSDDRMAYLRHIRDALIGVTDWTQAADSPLTAEQRAAWATYRQALRDLPQTYSGSGPIPWPAAPS